MDAVIVSLWGIACLAAGSGITFLVMRRRERRAERAQELRLAELARLDEPSVTGLPSWVVVGWHGDGENLSLAATSVSKALFSQDSQIEHVDFPGFRRKLQLVRRRCVLSVEFPAFTLLHGQGSFEDAVRELRTVWRPIG